MGFALMASAVEIEAQERTYEEDALRLDSGFGGLKIVRGVSDSVVLTIGIVRAVDVARLVAASTPQALDKRIDARVLRGAGDKPARLRLRSADGVARSRSRARPTRPRSLLRGGAPRRRYSRRCRPATAMSTSTA